MVFKSFPSFNASRTSQRIYWGREMMTAAMAVCGRFDVGSLKYAMEMEVGLKMASRAYPAPSFVAPKQLHLRRISRRCKVHSVVMSSSTGDGDPIREWIVEEGGATAITKISPVGGGCINTALRYETDVGSFFVKTNRDVGPAMFEAEAVGLNAMFATGTIRIPKPYKVGPLPRRGSYIIMEHISIGRTSGAQAKLGRQLAEMHKAGTSDKGFGFDMDNTIGSTPQRNPWTRDWITFFTDHRLGYQFELAEKQYRDFDLLDRGKRLLGLIPFYLRDLNIQPCLLHGDLWSGNIAADENGAPVILDPACYYGHNEAEFGMSWCAGFGSSFYDAYFKVLPKQPGFEKRRELYKLYHYLNHYNLFGSSYRNSCITIIQSLVNNV